MSIASVPAPLRLNSLQALRAVAAMLGRIGVGMEEGFDIPRLGVGQNAVGHGLLLLKSSHEDRDARRATALVFVVQQTCA
jgi:hypothetical protein